MFCFNYLWNSKLRFIFYVKKFFAIYLLYHISGFSCTTTFNAASSHLCLHHITLSCVDVFSQEIGKSPHLSCRLWNYCACHGDQNMYDFLVKNAFFMVILNLSFVYSKTGWNMVKRCFETPWRTKTGPTGIFIVRFGLFL